MLEDKKKKKCWEHEKESQVETWLVNVIFIWGEIVCDTFIFSITFLWSIIYLDTQCPIEPLMTKKLSLQWRSSYIIRATSHFLFLIFLFATKNETVNLITFLFTVSPSKCFIPFRKVLERTKERRNTKYKLVHLFALSVTHCEFKSKSL